MITIKFVSSILLILFTLMIISTFLLFNSNLPPSKKNFRTNDEITILKSSSNKITTVTKPIDHSTDIIISQLKSENAELRSQNKLLIINLTTNQQSVRAVASSTVVPPTFEYSYRPGVLILGMHRSGTSALGGLMNKMGLKTGGPLIGAAFDNKKGFFERLDVVIENDNLLRSQNIWYAGGTYKYDATLALKMALNNNEKKLFAEEGKKALEFLNNKNNFPWMLKDPRLCITFKTWLPMMSFTPAVLFMYRNPMDVALSMNKRETENFRIGMVLKVWYVYNKRAIQQSHDLCRVVSSHHGLLSDPMGTLQEIFHSLKERCHVPVPRQLSAAEVNDFVDVKLQHGNTSAIDTACQEQSRSRREHGGGAGGVNVISTLMPPSYWPTTDEAHLKLFRSCVTAYCALEDRSIFEPNFKWDESIKDI